MKAVVFDGELRLAEIPQPTPKDGEALIQVQLAGICNTDLEILKGYMNYKGVLGHEFVGVVKSSNSEEWIGKRVVGEINIGCGSCPLCLKGDSRHCQTRSVLGIAEKDGVFAEYVKMPFSNLYPVPEAVTNEQAVFVEPLAAACEILEQVHVGPNDSVAIVGDGKLGQLIAQVIRLTGCKLTVYGKSRKKLKPLSDLSIKTHVDNVDQLKSFDIVIEASGSPSGFSSALQLVRPRGTIVLKSTTHENLNFNAAQLVIDEIHLIGSRCGRFDQALRLFERNLIQVQHLISAIYPIQNAMKAIEMAGTDDVFKVVLDFSERA